MAFWNRALAASCSFFVRVGAMGCGIASVVAMFDVLVVVVVVAVDGTTMGTVYFYGWTAL